MLPRKSASKRVRIEIIPLELKEFCGDKRAYFLSEFQLELASNFIAQYGKDHRTLVFYEVNSPMAVWQTKLPVSFSRFIKEKEGTYTAIVLQIPVTFLRTRASEQILVRIKKTTPVQSFVPFGTHFDLNVDEMNHHVIQVKDGKVEIFKYASWDKIGIKYRSDK